MSGTVTPKYPSSLIILSVLLIIVISCTEKQNIENPSINVKPCMWLLDSIVSVEFAEEFAILYRELIDEELEEENTIEISETDSVIDSVGITAFYIINFDDDLGWVIVSADFKYEPILAYNPTGSFETVEKTVKVTTLDRFKLTSLNYSL
ncbi:MAG: hypothetical protein HOD63_15915 [Bacteroidetes bacterium]|jgi:hypothetical protein|nr:hypothetical protein [Bacteroidota bacterium]MBT5527669.1 hypothetical protein [Cytophagia bacterium]MBT3421890.1 hypothetical protein [Bacteroidota bacterium]MBT4340077.1 hypothetical protein [Bacteroidota bacterium]MBT4729749.1 hypothetical protein [Bacteroidota bacterium]